VENNPGALGFRDCGWGLLIRAVLGLGRVGTAAMLGFRAMTMPHASSGCGSGARVSSARGRSMRGGKGRAGGCNSLSRSEGGAAWGGAVTRAGKGVGADGSVGR
jgi:hypothetical protein